ncbi:MAG TPA: AMP-binding protein [Steroidobacter sp.]|uniref:AMP-binding protein n=1 Tax=Steroidobacter sp. TaxID=1978227 RepID=UPI002ED87F22
MSNINSKLSPRMPWSAFDATSLAYGANDFLHVIPGENAAPVTLTYREARDQVDSLSSRLHAAGFAPGHRVALALDNTAAFFLYFLALNRIGCSIVPINATMSREELRYVLAHADISAVFTHSGHVRALGEAVPSNCPLVDIENVAGPFAAPHGAPSARLDEAALLYTSGTTGTPKGCVLNDSYFRQIGAHYIGLGGYCQFRMGEERLLTPLPVTHMNALACSFMAMLLTGGCLIQLDRFHPSSWWRTVRGSRATCFHYLGVMPAMLLGAPPAAEDDVSSQVRFAFGAGVDPKHHAAFERRFGVPLIEAWAMTETGGGAWITANVDPRHVGERCFGLPPEGLEWRIVQESGEDAEHGEPGELWVRRAGDQPRLGFFDGYYKDEQASAAAWAEGWFHTGDIVRRGPDGSFFFVDRLKNIIRRSGENIAAVEVESVLMQSNMIRACAVTAVPDEMRGEEVFAFVVTKDTGSEASQADRLQRHCLEHLVYFKAPGYIAFVPDLPQTASQKVARGEVKRLAAQYLSSGKAIDLRQGKKRSAQRS